MTKFEFSKQEKNDMPNITLYMDAPTQKKLKELAKKEHRSVSKQVVHMLAWYLKEKD